MCAFLSTLLEQKYAGAAVAAAAATCTCRRCCCFGMTFRRQFNDAAAAAMAKGRRIEVSQMIRFPISELVDGAHVQRCCSCTLLFVTPVLQLRCRIRLRFAGTCLGRCAPSVAEFCVRCDCSMTKALSNEHGSLSLLLAMLQLNEQIVFIAILQRKLMAFTAGV
jgi:hypothetical protein